MPQSSSPRGSMAASGLFFTYAYRFQDCSRDPPPLSSNTGSIPNAVPELVHALPECSARFLLASPRREFSLNSTPAAKGRSAHHGPHQETVSSLAVGSITVIVRTESWNGIEDFTVLRGAARTLRVAHPITRSLSDAASNPTSLPALHSTEAAFCRLPVPRSFYSDSSSASASRTASSAAFCWS